MRFDSKPLTFSVLHIPHSVCCLRPWGRSSITGELKIFQDSENLQCFMTPTGGRIKVKQLKTDLTCELPFRMHDRYYVDF